VPFFKIYGELLQKVTDNNTKLILLGCSGNYYTEYEKKHVSGWLKKLDPFALIFRDPVAFDFYIDASKNVFKGIDNAFFVNRINIPMNCTSKEYTVVNIDSYKNKKLAKEISAQFSNVIFSCNKPYPISQVKKRLDKNIFVSDTPMDYLVLLANAKEVHSDRVHSCIPTLSMGGKCKLYSSSPRIKLFENVNLHHINQKLTSISEKDLNEYQNNQIDYLNNVLLQI
jgi:hypothetical protein